MYNPKHIN